MKLCDMHVLCILASITFFSIDLPAIAEESAAQAAEKMKRVDAAAPDYYNCVHTYALRFVSTAALPSDIADAALAGCESAENVLRRAILETGLSVDSAEGIVAKFNSVARRRAIRDVVQARFPNK